MCHVDKKLIRTGGVDLKVKLFARCDLCTSRVTLLEPARKCREAYLPWGNIPLMPVLMVVPIWVVALNDIYFNLVICVFN